MKVSLATFSTLEGSIKAMMTGEGASEDLS